MTVVSPSQSNAGDTIEASDINTPVNQLAAVINGGIDATNITDNSISTAKVADTAITPAKLQTGSGGSWVWQSYTPTITAQTGTFTTVSATGRYIQTGKTVTASLTITVTTVGTAGSGIICTLPVNAQSTTGYVGSGREDNATGKMLQTRLNNANNTAVIYNYDNTTAVGNGNILRLLLTYEAA